MQARGNLDHENSGGDFKEIQDSGEREALIKEGDDSFEREALPTQKRLSLQQVAERKTERPYNGKSPSAGHTSQKNIGDSPAEFLKGMAAFAMLHGKCSVCMEALEAEDAIQTLQCEHTFHGSCLEALRDIGLVSDAFCSICRAERPTKREGAFELAARRYCIIGQRVKRGGTSWAALTGAERREMREVITITHINLAVEHTESLRAAVARFLS